LKKKKRNKKVIGILTADWHLSHKAPVWRSNEPDWYAAMKRPLLEIEELSKKHRDCPVFATGDIFDKWNSPAELINFAIKNIPREVIAIPGQHDLPNHNIKELSRSAFASLTLSKAIKYVRDTYSNKHKVHTTTFPYGYPIEKLDKCYLDFVNIALVHDYVWISKHSYPNAPEEKRVPLRPKKKNMVDNKYYGYDVIVYGDNHKGFKTYVGDTTIFNCGTLMRRKSDEEDYKPQVGLLYDDGSVEAYYLDVSEDKHLTAEAAKQMEEIEELDITELATELKKLGSSALDFADAIKHQCRKSKIEKPVRDVLNKAMEK